jgi:general secretion pathway protein G
MCLRHASKRENGEGMIKLIDILRAAGGSRGRCGIRAASTARPDGKRRQDGFTLLELLVVLAILGLLMLLVVPNVMKNFGNAKLKIARQSIEGLNTVLDLYKLDVGNYPSTEQGLPALQEPPSGVSNWHGPYIKGDKLPVDPWGHPFVYRVPSERPSHDYDICSLGQTGQPGGNGDDAEICND